MSERTGSTGMPTAREEGSDGPGHNPGSSSYPAQPEAHTGATRGIALLTSIEDEINLLAKRRDIVDRWVLDRLAEGEGVDLLKYLSYMASTGARIARMLKDYTVLSDSTLPLEDLFNDALDRLKGDVGADL